MLRKQELPPLPFDYGALEPVLSGKLMELHHSKHHAAYVAKLNEALEKYAEAEQKGDLAALIGLHSAIGFNGGGHLNHSLFWANLSPRDAGGGTPPQGALATAIDETFGSLQKFVDQFNAKALAVQGSGWGWLGYHKERKTLELLTTSNHELATTAGYAPLLCIDVWEHAYYLDYKNARIDFLKAIWQVVNWQEVTARYTEAHSKLRL